MLLVVRDEDVPTVAAAVRAYAAFEGLEPLEDAGGGDVFVAMSEDGVVVRGLDGLDIADADEWATKLSAEFETEVIALDVADDGVRVYVFSDGELEHAIEMPLVPGGRTASAELPELEEPIEASTPDELAEAILQRFGVGAADEGVALAFADPADRRFDVAPLLGASLEGTVGATIVSPVRYAFGVTLLGVEAVEGCRLALRGDALALVNVVAVEVAFRTATEARVVRTLVPEHTGDGLVVVVDDALFERVDVAPVLDFSDVFSSMQNLVSVTEDQQRNTMLVGIVAVAGAPGDAELVLEASSPDDVVGAGAGALPVSTRA